ncbi:MAG: WD40 repeat domain-containing protein, partial [Gemmataceae bacterium]
MIRLACLAAFLIGATHGAASAPDPWRSATLRVDGEVESCSGRPFYSPDGRMVVTFAKDSVSELLVWEAATLSLRAKLVLAHGGERMKPQGVLFSPDGSRLVCVTAGRPELLLSTPVAGDRWTSHGPFTGDSVSDMAFVPGSHTLAVLTGSACAFVDTRSGKVVSEMRTDAEVYTAMALHPTKPLIALASSDGLIRVRACGDGKDVAVLRGHRYG